MHWKKAQNTYIIKPITYKKVVDIFKTVIGKHEGAGNASCENDYV